MSNNSVTPDAHPSDVLVGIPMPGTTDMMPVLGYGYGEQPLNYDGPQFPTTTMPNGGYVFESNVPPPQQHVSVYNNGVAPPPQIVQQTVVVECPYCNGHGTGLLSRLFFGGCGCRRRRRRRRGNFFLAQAIMRNN